MSRTELTRAKHKERTDRAILDELLDSVRIGYFGLIAPAGHPVVIPATIVRDGDRILTHGSTGSTWRRQLAAGSPTCLTVATMDAVVVARTAYESSVHYRSAVLFGACRQAEDKAHALDLIVDGVIPGRSAEVRPHTGKELAATEVLEMPIAEWSLKVSDGWPADAPEDIAGPAWAGVVPLLSSHGEPLPAPDLRAGIPLPPSVRRLARTLSAPPC
ncbi:MAG: pyridoxamine 5'-phosphate oxidase family protein [Actinomycetia bacterium]|nr:pyridoxamine 5'-phosphate oxidase family protein [Actinomycetes bacterium]